MNKPTIFLLIALPLFFACTQKEQEVRVESVSVNPTTASLTIGETLQLKASVSPSSATKKDIIWSSSKPSVASVSASGLVTAVGEGMTTITATADGKKDECSVSVVKKTIAVSEVKLDKTELTLFEGDEETLTASVSPEDATDKTITWTSSDKSIATVESGKVKAVGKGTAKITASASGKTAFCSIEVLRPVSGISLNKTNLELPLEKTEILTATIIPSDATLREDITWSSSNSDVATVDGGNVTAVSMGNATITASLEGFKAECNVVVKGMEYGKVAINDLKPVEILPFIDQVTEGNMEVYYHIEHLRLAEATRIRDMMWEYGAGSHSKEAYQQLMGRLNTGMTEEYPSGYDNFNIMGGGQYTCPEDQHAHKEWSILNSLVHHAHFQVVITKGKTFEERIADFLSENPNAILIMGNSSYAEQTNRDDALQWTETPRIKELCRAGQFILFKSGGNIKRVYGVFINKTYHIDYYGDEHGLYSLQSFANGINDAIADMALLVTVGTNDTGDCDQTGETTSSSRFPVGFHDKVLFSGRAFPSQALSGVYSGEGGRSNNGKYATSYTNYVNVAMMSICFQMYAEAKDVFELLDMVRSTCLTNYIRLDGQTQPLQLINPAGLYKKYLTPQNLPTAISSDETLSLDKGYYKGVLFCIPGAEVKINGEWIAFDNKNKDTILSQNPMNLEWRLNGDLIRKYGYSSGQTIEGQIITVDDQWGGLRLEVPMSVHLR